MMWVHGGMVPDGHLYIGIVTLAYNLCEHQTLGSVNVYDINWIGTVHATTNVHVCVKSHSNNICVKRGHGIPCTFEC